MAKHSINKTSHSKKKKPVGATAVLEKILFSPLVDQIFDFSIRNLIQFKSLFYKACSQEFLYKACSRTTD